MYVCMYVMLCYVDVDVDVDVDVYAHPLPECTIFPLIENTLQGILYHLEADYTF